MQKRPRFVPCTPAGVMELLARSGVALAGRRAVVLGRSDIVGKPMALLLLHADATVTVCHSRTHDLASVTREADLLVAAIGRPGIAARRARQAGGRGGRRRASTASARPSARSRAAARGAPARVPQKRGYALVGDVHAPQVAEVAAALTPVPGGVGPLTIAMLMKNTVRAAADCGLRQGVLRVGLTGGIACGKSHVLRRLAARGCHTLDLDASRAR